jgi:hypothetical protein
MESNNITKIKKEIEKETEQKIINKYYVSNEIKNKNNIDLNKEVKELKDIMNEGAIKFKEKVGREMSYSEMREMYG